MNNSKAFTAYIYEQERQYLEWLVLQRQKIETGGDLFGLWQNEDIVIVQLILGPGKSCTRTETSFYQDIEYLSSVGRELTSSHGLCNVGSWHSHHRIALSSPSQGDQTTVWNHVDAVAGGRFLVFIATITGSNEQPRVNIGCFMFSSKTRKMSEGSLLTLQNNSPIRGQFNDASFRPGPENGVSWGEFVKANRNMKNRLASTCCNSVEDENNRAQKTNDKLTPVTGKEHHRKKGRDVTHRDSGTSSDSTKNAQNKSTTEKRKSNSKPPRPAQDPQNQRTRDVPTLRPGNHDRKKLQTGKEETREISAKTKLVDGKSNSRYGSVPNVPRKFGKKKTRKKNVITTPPESSDCRRMRQVVTSSSESRSDNYNQNNWRSMFCCFKSSYRKLDKEEYYQRCRENDTFA